MADPGRWSPSKLEVCLGCPMWFFLKYIKHVRVPLKVNLIFGKEMHYMLERFYDVDYKSADSFANSFGYRWGKVMAGDFLDKKTKTEPNFAVTEYPYFVRGQDGQKIEKILRIGNHVRIFSDPVKTFFGYKNLGKSIMRRFFNRHKTKSPPLHKEMAFGKKKEEPVDIEGYHVTGVFDRIDEFKDGQYITDYKTNKSSPGADSFVLHRSPQFTLYSYVFRKLFGIVEKAILYYHLRSGNVFKTHRSEKDYDYLMSLLDKASDIVVNERFVPFYSANCLHCDFKVPCEKYSVGKHFGGPRIDLEEKISTAEVFDWDIKVPEAMEMETEER